jgi:hypothetical protein
MTYAPRWSFHAGLLTLLFAAPGAFLWFEYAKTANNKPKRGFVRLYRIRILFTTAMFRLLFIAALIFGLITQFTTYNGECKPGDLFYNECGQGVLKIIFAFGALSISIVTGCIDFISLALSFLVGLRLGLQQGEEADDETVALRTKPWKKWRSKRRRNEFGGGRTSHQMMESGRMSVNGSVEMGEVKEQRGWGMFGRTSMSSAGSDSSNSDDESDRERGSGSP